MATSIIPDFEAAFMAIDRVEHLLRRVADALENAQVPYAVVGGHADAAWVASVDPNAIRSTKDVDLSRRGLKVIDLVSLVVMKLQSNRAIDQAHFTDMKGVGLITAEVMGAAPADLRDRLAAIPEPDTH